MISSHKLRALAAEASPEMRRNIEAALTLPEPEKPSATSGIRMPKGPKMSKTEQEYGAMLRQEYPDCTVLFEPFSIRLKSGAKYTPDWIVMRGNAIKVAVETKGGYRLQSAARSHLAFKTAVQEWPDWHWRYAEKKDGQWIIQDVYEQPFKP